MHCLLEELNDLSVLPWGWVMLRRTPDTDPTDGFIEIRMTSDTDLIERNRKLEAVTETAKRLSAGSSDRYFDKMAGMFNDVLVRADDMQALNDAITDLEDEDV